MELIRGAKGFGFSIRGGQDFGLPVYILKVTEDGPARADGRIQVGGVDDCDDDDDDGDDGDGDGDDDDDGENYDSIIVIGEYDDDDDDDDVTIMAIGDVF